VCLRPGPKELLGKLGCLPVGCGYRLWRAASPRSHSMLSDLYPKEQRSSAMHLRARAFGIFGIMIGFMVGGFVAEWWGSARGLLRRRGLPGIAILCLVRSP